MSFYDAHPAPDTPNQPDIPDSLSITSTTSTSASLLTRYTNAPASATAGSDTSRKTAKNRRREERKKARGKKGSVYEEQYLVGSVERLVERVNGVVEDVEATVTVLARRGMWERARTLEALLAEVAEGCRKGVAEVFVQASGDGNGGIDGVPIGGEEMNRVLTGGERVLQETMVEQQSGHNQQPTVKGFKRLCYWLRKREECHSEKLDR